MSGSRVNPDNKFSVAQPTGELCLLFSGIVYNGRAYTNLRCGGISILFICHKYSKLCKRYCYQDRLQIFLITGLYSSVHHVCWSYRLEY